MKLYHLLDVLGWYEYIEIINISNNGTMYYGRNDKFTTKCINADIYLKYEIVICYTIIADSYNNKCVFTIKIIG